MVIFKLPQQIKSFLHIKRSQQLRIGFIPTMGALHKGHISLMDTARAKDDVLVSSIFVNPTQFNDPNDFKKYPLTLEKDIQQLENSGCDVLFIPSVAEIYPNGTQIAEPYALGYLEEILEGKYRPGHFQGVCQVVHRLLNIANPTDLYLGQKDFQQCMVIRKLIDLTGLETELVICPTSREPGGLAMSSRNMRLNEEERQRATSIYESLTWIRDNIDKHEPAYLKNTAFNMLTEKGFKVDYVEIANQLNLRPVDRYKKDEPLIALVAAYINDVRLIDNMPLNP